MSLDMLVVLWKSRVINTCAITNVSVALTNLAFFLIHLQNAPEATKLSLEIQNFLGVTQTPFGDSGLRPRFSQSKIGIFHKLCLGFWDFHFKVWDFGILPPLVPPLAIAV